MLLGAPVENRHQGEARGRFGLVAIYEDTYKAVYHSSLLTNVAQKAADRNEY